MAIRRFFLLVPVLFASTLLHAYNSSTDRLLSGTPISSSSSSPASNAFDNNASTYFSSSSTYEMQWVGLDLGAQYVITRVGYTTASGSQGADRALLCLFEGANSPDFMDAIPLHLITEMPTGGTATTADVNVSRGFRYVRYVGGCDCVDYNENNSDCHIAELKFYGHAGEGDDTQFYQITNLPTLSVHVQDDNFPSARGEDFDSQSVLIYDGGTLIQEYPIFFRRRGNYPDYTANKSYRIKYNDVVDGKSKSHHMMRGGVNESPAKAKKWVLISSYRDKTLMRNPVAWAMSKRGEREWTPWSQVVDLIVNGDYRGTYTLADAVTVDKYRINITELMDSDLDEESITGGYALEVDNRWGDEPANCKFRSVHDNPITIDAPDDDVIQPQQLQYIKNAWDNMENIIFGSSYSDPVNGLRSVLDVDSFLKWFLISEFNGNTDMICQVFMFKERGDDLFYTGPIWDADLALENDINYYPSNQRSDWTYKVRHTGHWDQFVSRVLSDPYVFSRLREIWAELRNAGKFNPEAVAADVDSLRNQVRSSASLNFLRWPYLNQWVSDTTPEVPGSWEEEVDRVRDYVSDRVAWMDDMLSYGTLPEENGVYQIASALDLCTFSQMVNQGGDTSAEAELVADIDMTDYSDFQPIGTSSMNFAGSFDGNGHTIRNLHLSGSTGVGLFGYTSTCTLSNIVFDSTCSASGTVNVGMLVGNAYGGVVYISGVENHGTVTATSYYAGGLVGYASSAAIVDIANSSNTGAVTAPYNAAAIVGPSVGMLSVSNSYNVGTITGATPGKEFAYSNNSTFINNCWDYTSSALTNSMTPDQVDNGWLCFHINNNAGKDIWHQNLDNGKTHNLWPVLGTAGSRVFEKDGAYTNYNPNPAKYRYYKLVVTKLQGTKTVIQFSEFDILDEWGSEVEDLQIYDGTPSDIPDENWYNLADNKVSTKYCKSDFYDSAYFLFDARSEITLCGYRFYTANDTQSNPDRNPCSWRLYGSNTMLVDPEDPNWELVDEQIDNYSLPAANYTPQDFYISDPVRSLSLSEQSATLVRGETLQLEVNFIPSTLQGMTLQWTSTNSSVATVDGQGLVTAKGIGTANIIVSAVEDNTLRDTCTVVVMAYQPGYRYYQLAVEAVGGADAIQMSEFDLLDKDGNEINPLTMYACVGPYYGEESQYNLFDDNVYTKYCGSSENPIYIFIDAGRRVELSGYRITTANDNSRYVGRSPVTWSLFGSNTKSTVHDDEDWKLLDRHEDDYSIRDVNYTPFDFVITNASPSFYVITDETTSFDVVNQESGCSVMFTHDFNGEWEAIYLPFAIDYDAISADFDLAEIDDIVQNDDNYDGVPDVTLLCIMGLREQMTTPNTPYLIRAKNAGIQTLDFADIMIYPTVVSSLDCSSTSIRYEFIGSYEALSAASLTERYVIQNGELVKGASSLAPCRWYMTATARKGALNLPNRICIMPVEDVITGVEVPVETVKSQDIYTLDGRKVSHPSKGIYIMNGKKILMK